MRAAEREAIASWERELREIADDRRLLVESWLENTRESVRLAAAYPTAVWLASGRPPEPLPFPPLVGAETHLRRLLDTLCQEAGFASVLLVDRSGAVLASGGRPSPADREPSRLAAVAGRDLESLEIDADGDGSAVRFGQPVRSTRGGELVGALVAREDAGRSLLPALAWRGRPASSGETFLVERKAGVVRALSPRAQVGLQPANALPPGVGALLEWLSESGAHEGRAAPGPASPRIAAYVPIRGVPCGVATTMSRAEAGEGRQVEVVAKVAAAALAVIAALLGALVVRERRRARREAAAHVRDARLVSAIERTRDVALLVHEDGTIAEALGATDRIYGVPASALAGRRLEDLRAPELRAAHGRTWAGAPERGTLSEETHIRGDGTLAPVEVSTSPVAGRDGDRWYLALVRDAAERRKAEEATRTLARAIEQSPTSILVTDLEGRIEYVNPRFCEVTGYAIAEVLGQPARILKSGVTPDAVYADLWRTIRAGRVWHGELVNRRRDGTHFTERASIAPVADARGKVTHYVAVKEDLTEWKDLEARASTAEARFLQSQKLEAVGQLASGVAHDFNNLLCVILGYGQLVVDELGPESPQTARVELIVKAGHTAEALTRQLLAFSRHQVLQPRVLDLNQVVRGVEKMLRRLIGEDVTLVVELAAEPAVVRVDAGQAEQVLLNLVVNARDAMPTGGRLTIRNAFEAGGGRFGTPGIEIPGGPWVVLSIVDTGRGMDAATQARVFEPFFTTKPMGVGAGLGLTTVFAIVQQSGGHIGFASALGQGTEFRIYLPRLALEAEADDHVPADLRAYEGTETVLVAEDQEPVRQIVRLWLERRGYRVLEAEDGRAGLKLAAEEGPVIDLLLSDVVMPGMGGRALADALQARRPGLPVIFISGYAGDVIAQRGALPSGCRLLEKPLSEAGVVRAVREALDAAKGASPPAAGAPG